MAKELLEHLWQDRKASVIIAIDLIKRYYKDDRLNENQHDTVSIKAKIEKAQTRLTNLIAMRADGELSKEEYQAMRKPIDTEIQQLQDKLNQAPNDEQPKRGLELDGIISTLNRLIDFSGTKVSEEVINQFVYRVTPTSDTTFDWYVNLTGKGMCDVGEEELFQTASENTKKDCMVKGVEFSAEESDYEIFAMSNGHHSAMLDTGRLRDLAKEIYSSFLYIVPVSIYEVLVIPEDNVFDLSELQEFSRNRKELLDFEEAVLSERVYRYSLESGDINFI